MKSIANQREPVNLVPTRMRLAPLENSELISQKEGEFRQPRL
jgi:hypothetical protein